MRGIMNGVSERIVVGGRDDESAVARPQRRPHLAIALVILTLAGLVLMLRRPAPLETATAGEDPVDAPVRVETTLPPTLDEQIEGLSEVLVITDDAGRVSIYAPSDTAQEYRDLPAGITTTDSSGRWLATYGGDEDPGPVFAGNANAMIEVSPDATGVVWHPFEPARLAWIEPGTEGLVLVEGYLTPGPEIRTNILGPVPAESRPAWWSQGGIVLQAEGAVLVLAPGSGVTIGVADEGHLLPATIYWAILKRSGEREVFVNPVLREVGSVPWSSDCTPPVSEPGRERFVAIVCPEGGTDGGTLQIWSLESGGDGEFAELLHEQRGFSPEVTPAWTRDGRFVVAASADRTWIVAYDLQDGALDAVRVDGAIAGLAVVAP